MRRQRKLDPCEERLAALGVDVYTRNTGDEDECHWRGTLIDRCETRIHNLNIQLAEMTEAYNNLCEENSNGKADQ